MNESLNYRFIKNQPLGEDLFENKSQDKIASIISEKIINESDFKIIGIDGEWGSGKSNLVKLIEKKLENNHKFFIYDVWGHQEDEQRKSILVELTEFIKSEKDLVNKKNNWENKLRFLLAKSKETTTINQPNLSGAIVIGLLSVPYFAFVNLIKDVIDKVEYLDLGTILTLIPPIILLSFFLRYFWKNFRNKKGIRKSSCLALHQMSQIYTEKQINTTKIETISENEPSVREFQNWMQDINDDLKKPIVIVFDNFDRLPKKHILSIWSSIHIFFAEKSYSKIKVIIPFDREHIQNAFKDLNGEESRSVENKGKNKNFGEDYVNKTFDIVFRVTKPIMSDWKKFFEEQWKKAFIKYDEAEMKLVVQVYEFLNRRITPREIISFINELLTIKLLDENYKERYIGIFILRKNEILANPLKAVSDYKEILDGLYHIYVNDKEYPKQLTAIIYHIEVDKALELIYTQELRDSMLKNNVQKFNKICKADFIDSIFYSAMLSIKSFENPILILSSLDENSKVSTQYIKQTWNTFYNGVLDLGTRMGTLIINDWQITLIKNIDDDKYLSHLLKDYSSLINDTNIEEYIDLIDELINHFTEERVLRNLKENEISEANYVNLIEYNGEGYEKYKLSADYKALDKYLSKLDIKDILKLERMVYLPKNYDFKEYREKLKVELENFGSRSNIQSANDTLIRIKEISHKSGILKDLLSDNSMGSLYSNNQNSELPIINELIAMRIARGSSFSSSYGNYFNGILSQENEKRAEQIANTILNYITYGDLLLMSNYFKNYPLFRQIILKMFGKYDLGKSANIITLINKYSEIKTSLNIDDDSLLNELNKWEVDKNKLDINKLDDEFLSDCFENESLKISQVVVYVFNEEFSNFDKDNYEIVFDNDGNDVHFRFFKYLEPENLTQVSLDVFETKFIELLENGSNFDEQWWSILEIYDANNSSISVVNLFKNILDKILNSKIELSLELANKLLPYFFKYDLLVDRNDIFRLVIKNDFLSDTQFVKLLSKNSEKLKGLYQKASKDDKDGFRNWLNEQRDNNTDIENLARFIDIRRIKGKENQ
ncbi:P-loop NTPase fold protein [Capnocytophaga cynodegmi]|uniref:KAP NTPase domain-containing protein n=1 Tax=Capnocytophaga cynodegmi TaxID=28189 RepID=A0A0B7HWN6_9FLAO|nr:P-loop NTPase fold protein [Capnocytophaga cynodegmi]CEN36627.1 conserved hypothetical protein [Capnocytophaga cynodegmi]CEN42307.1 conserved hypothetical protein [Capnocytophaga cynodegmi]